MPKLEHGEIIKTLSGRDTTPFPKFSFDSDRKASNSLKRINKWLIDNAIKEAKSTNNDFILTILSGLDNKKLSKFDADFLNMYLFGDIE